MFSLYNYALILITRQANKISLNYLRILNKNYYRSRKYHNYDWKNRTIFQHVGILFVFKYNPMYIVYPATVIFLKNEKKPCVIFSVGDSDPQIRIRDPPIFTGVQIRKRSAIISCGSHICGS